MTSRRLRIVDEPPERPDDVTMLLRADILKRDWSACHVEADRRRPVAVPDQRKRLWLR
jgi:hypothetical protein